MALSRRTTKLMKLFKKLLGRPTENAGRHGRRVITFGTFDLLHEGHIRILERARAEGDYLIVGISTDALNALKGKSAMFSQAQRRAYVEALEVVDETFFEESLEQKDNYIQQYEADVLVMGDDWAGQFDWVSCEVLYLPRTENVSSSHLKRELLAPQKNCRILFGDTYVKKHYDCSLSMVNEMLAANIAPVFTQAPELPRNLSVDCLVYFNKPRFDPPEEYADVPRVCIDHGASNLKWFLAGKARFEFFDRIITAGPDHSRSILSFYPATGHNTRVHSAGFIKSPDLLAPPTNSRKEICRAARLDHRRPITLFVPTWYIARNLDIQTAIEQLATIDNHVAILHPETDCLETDALNVMENSAGIVTELMKHADCIVSDLSSTIFEAAPLGKPVVQILMREYSDNNATMFDFPYVAGTADLFCGGIPTRPEGLADLVHDIYARPEKYQDQMAAYQKRVMRGTLMDGNVAGAITSELLISCREPRPSHDVDLDAVRHEGMQRVNQNLALQRHRIIAHGAGDYFAQHASNSLEAIKTALNAIGFVEVDVVKGADDILLAHNGFEEKYGFDKPFESVTRAEFKAAKFNDVLTTITLEEFFALFRGARGFAVFDVKNMDGEYEELVTEVARLAREYDVLDRVIVQAYCKKDFEIVVRLGIKRAILAVWKYFYLAPLGTEAMQFLEDCLAINDPIVYGLSIPYYNHHMPAPSIEMDELAVLHASFKRVFIHGAPQDRYPDILRRNLGLFADAFKKGIQFRHVRGRFGWRRYLFLNPGLVEQGIDNQVSATCHYVEWGENEQRAAEYDVPADFSPSGYIEKNRDLKLAGVVGPDSARSHWTRFGKDQTRRY